MQMLSNGMLRSNFSSYRATYQRDDYVTITNVVRPQRLTAMRAQMDLWKEELCQYNVPYGEIMDDRQRFEIEPLTQRPNSPALRQRRTQLSGLGHVTEHQAVSQQGQSEAARVVLKCITIEISQSSRTAIIIHLQF